MAKLILDNGVEYELDVVNLHPIKATDAEQAAVAHVFGNRLAINVVTKPLTDEVYGALVTGVREGSIPGTHGSPQ
jgi:hypothetical protein